MTLGNGLHGATLAEMRTEFKFGFKSQIDRRLSRDIMTFHTCGVVWWLRSGLIDEESFESWQGQESFPLSKTFGQTLGSTRLFVPLLRGGRVSPAVRPSQGVKMTTQLPCQG